ncbi:CgeB family protein [Paenibacillus senegalensis]|uniref:CgeB family protein n=1 Tax=Paenibacillus senegalensis TaxID=1465766 RepID=UPI00028851B7|nr:glycosyltransferase [Paenibacillus senegalensis]
MSQSPLRITFIGRYTEGTTGIVRSIFMGLLELGHTVQEINVGTRTSLLYNPNRRMGGNGPVYVRLELIREELRAFKPDLIICCAGGLTFVSRDMAELKRLAPVWGITLSDPDVFPTISVYAHEFSYHTTNSQLAYRRYLNRGFNNIGFMPFAVDSRFFVPRPPNPNYQCDVAIVGHARPDRVPLAKRLQAKFGAVLYGRNWPGGKGPVHGEEWFQAVYSTKCLISFPKTGAGYTNVKVGVFEAAATGRLMLVPYFEEIKRYFDYDREIVGFSNEQELFEKLSYYLRHEDERNRIAEAARMRCALEHTWAKRLSPFIERAANSSANRFRAKHREDMGNQ